MRCDYCPIALRAVGEDHGVHHVSLIVLVETTSSLEVLRNGFIDHVERRVAQNYFDIKYFYSMREFKRHVRNKIGAGAYVTRHCHLGKVVNHSAARYGELCSRQGSSDRFSNIIIRIFL